MRIPIVVAYTLPPIPVVGWIVAQSLTERITEFSHWTGAWVHTLAASTFAVILFASAVVNAAIVSRRVRDRPRSYRLSRYVVWQLGVIALSLAWLGCLIIGEPAYTFEPFIGIAIAIASIVTFVFVVRPDAESRERRVVRLEGIRSARSPESAGRVRIARVVIPVAVVALSVIGIVISAVVPIQHPGCDIVGSGVFDGTESVFTSNCGDFTLASDLSRNDFEGTVDITSRGFAWGPPLQPLAVAVTVHG
jgi:hypothetical protein